MKLLFIGNSYTFFSDMPELFRKLAEENSKELEVYSVTKGGRKLVSFLDAEDEYTVKLEKLLAENSFDTVILQDNSTVSLLDRDAFNSGVTYLAERFKALGARVILYETWGRKDGSPTLDEHGWTHDGMSEAVAHAYADVARELNIEVSRAGAAFHYALRHFPDIDIYNPDKTHPSYVGSCLIAMKHYETVYGEPPEKSDTLSLDSATLDAFRETLSAI